MQITLNDSEIRAALAEAMAKKLDHQFEINAENCWFEARAGEVNEEVVEAVDISDVHAVRFTFDTETN